MRVKQIYSSDNLVRIQQFGMSSSYKWKVVPEITQTMSTEYLTKEGLILLEDYMAESDWLALSQQAIQKQPQLADISSPIQVWKELIDQFKVFDISKLPVLSPKDIEERKNNLLDSFTQGKITRDQLEKELHRLEGSLHSRAWIPTPTWDGGYYSSPTDLGKDPKGDFPSESWLPRGQEDASVNEDIVSPTKEPPTINSEDHERRAKVDQSLGREYGEVFSIIDQLCRQGYPLDYCMNLVLKHSPYNLDPKVLEQLFK